MNTMKTLALGSIFGLAAMFAPSAKAADVGVSVGVGVPTAPAPVIIDGRYYESVWVPPTYHTDVVNGVSTQVVVTQGYYQQVARPEVVYSAPTAVYVEPSYYAPAYYYRDRPSFGFSFGFGGSRHWHHR